MIKRRVDLAKITSEVYDLAIIGGGITGAGILNEASGRGYKCILLEKGDFASGTSSKSAKLIHGGMRYLKYGKFDMVRESLEERNYLLTNFPHLVKPIPFTFPVYNSKYKYKLGMAIYQYLSQRNNLPEYKSLTTEETLQNLPFITPDGLKGSYIYYDAVTNDARLCNEVISNSVHQFDSVALNYCEFKQLERTAPLKISCLDHLENKYISIQANNIVNATGVWTDEVSEKLTGHRENISAPSTGIHIVLSLDRFPIDSAVVIPSYIDDERLLYAIPWENNSCIIGTTDQDYKGDIENVKIEKADIQYILHALQQFAPSLKISKKDIIYTYTGLRPLIREDKSKSSSARARDYHIWWSDAHVINIFGGKLTSFHSMAVALMNELAVRYPLKISSPGKQPIEIRDAIPVDFVRKMDTRYGNQSDKILQLVIEDSEFIRLAHPELDIHVAELVYYIRYQSCYRLDDLMSRRLSLTYVITGFFNYPDIVKSMAEIMKWECFWSESFFKQEIEGYLQQLNQSITSA